MLLISLSLFVILYSRSLRSKTGVAKLEFFKYGLKKMSHGVRSQKGGGQIVRVDIFIGSAYASSIFLEVAFP